MAKITYNLSTKINKNGESEILLDIQPERGVHYRMKSGVWVTPENYGRLMKAGRITALDYLSILEKRLYDAFPCDKDKAMEILNGVRNSDDLMSAYDEFARSRIIEKGLTSGTQEMYHSVRMILASYLDGKPASVRAINIPFLNGLVEHMCDKGMNNVTQKNYWGIFRVFLSHLESKGMMEHIDYKPKFKVVDNDVIYLTHNELYRMLGLKLKGKDRIVRDAFLVQCFTGMRHSDMVNIRKENIQEDANGKYISILTKKTSQRLKIYFNTTAEEILENYDWNLPWCCRNVMNDHLEKIAKAAHIDSEVEKVRYVGNRRKVEKKKKYECVTTHCARRTFICLCIENGVSTPIIQSVTGHRQLSSFQKYVGIADKSKSDMVRKLEI